MHSPKLRDPSSEVAISAFLANGGEIKKVPPGAHGTCERKKGIDFRRKDDTQVRMETLAAAEEEARRRDWINQNGGLALCRERGIVPPWEMQDTSSLAGTDNEGDVF